MKTFALKKYSYLETTLAESWRSPNSCHWTIYRRVNDAYPDVWTAEEKEIIESFYIKAWELRDLEDIAHAAYETMKRGLKGRLEAEVSVQKYHVLSCAWKKKTEREDFPIDQCETLIYQWARERFTAIGKMELENSLEYKAYAEAQKRFDEHFDANRVMVNGLIAKIFKPSYRWDQKWIGDRY